MTSLREASVRLRRCVAIKTCDRTRNECGNPGKQVAGVERVVRESIEDMKRTPSRFDGSLLSCGNWSARLSALGDTTANEIHTSPGDETSRHGTEQWELYAPEDRSEKTRSLRIVLSHPRHAVMEMLPETSGVSKSGSKRHMHVSSQSRKGKKRKEQNRTERL
jgi:hypothetical protein